MRPRGKHEGLCVGHRNIMHMKRHIVAVSFQFSVHNKLQN